MKSLQKRILLGTIWTFGGQTGTLFIALATNLVISRVLNPYEFGQVGIIIFFIAFANVISEGGLGGALIRKDEVLEVDLSTAFTCNFIISSFCYLILIVFSNTIATYYQDESLQNMILVAGLILFLNSLTFVSNIKLMRAHRFDLIFKYKFVSVIASSIIGISMAYCGFGVWSVIAMQLASALFTLVVISSFEGLDLQFGFNAGAFRSIYTFGVYTTLASLLNTIFDNIYQIIIGRHFTIGQVGLFYQAKRLQDVPIAVINGVIQGVVYTSLATLQNASETFYYSYSRIKTILSVLMGCICTLIIIYSDDMIQILLGNQWIAVGPYLRVLSIASFFYIQEMFSRVVFKIYDQTKIILLLEGIKKLFQLVTIGFGVYTMEVLFLLYGLVLTNVVGYMINIYSVRSLTNRTIAMELIMTSRVLLAAGFCIGLSSFLETVLQLSVALKLASSVMLIVIYFSFIWAFGLINVLTEGRKMLLLIRTKI